MCTVRECCCAYVEGVGCVECVECAECACVLECVGICCVLSVAEASVSW